MSYYLLNNAVSGPVKWHAQRRGGIKAIVIHITAGLEDLDALDDNSAEATAAYAASTSRAVSWHSGSDTDSYLYLLPPEAVAFHVRGYNTHTYGHEISKRDTNWGKMPKGWVDRTLDQAAAALKPIAERFSVPYRVATKAELDRAKLTDGPPVGFIGHSVLDPGRRSDPGADFPWQDLFRRMEGDDMADFFFDEDDKKALRELLESYKHARNNGSSPWTVTTLHNIVEYVRRQLRDDR